MIDSSTISERALVLIILIGLAIMIYTRSTGGKIKDTIKEFFKGDFNE